MKITVRAWNGDFDDSHENDHCNVQWTMVTLLPYILMTVTGIHVVYKMAIMMTIVYLNVHDKLPVYTMVRAS